MKKLETEKLEDLVNSGLHLVDFYAEWCGPCKMLMSVLEEINEEINIIKIDVDTHNDLATSYRIMSVPTLLLFKDGNIVKQVSGFHSKDELLNIINEFK